MFNNIHILAELFNQSGHIRGKNSHKIVIRVHLEVTEINALKK